jgi:hypothetical protein
MPRPKLTREERREKNRLRSERWRRARGIPPRKPARRPWLAEGISRSTWYRRKAKAREQAALAAREAVFDRMAWQVAELRESLDRAAAFNAIIGEVLGAALPLIW